MKQRIINLGDQSPDMKIIYFSVQGSATEPYKVTFQKNGNKLSAYCTCPAGKHGQYCKHRFRILGGLTDDIVSNNVSAVDEVKSWLSGTDVESVLTEVAKKGNAFEKAKKEFSIAKKKLARTMND